jgi:hypothetical protein
MSSLIINTYVSLMYELKKIGKVFTSKFVGTGPSSFKREFTGSRSHKGCETLVYAII